MTFRGVIATAVISVTAVAPLKEVAQTLIDHRISGVPVVDDSGRVVGVVSEGDFLFKESGPAAIRRRRLAGPPPPPSAIQGHRDPAVRGSRRRPPARR